MGGGNAVRRVGAASASVLLVLLAVDAHGGRIEVDSVPGRGTTMW